MSESAREKPEGGFDRAAAVTRSLLGYGVIAGPIYVTLGLVQAFTRDGFDLTDHSLSLLANGSWGWVQAVNFLLTGLMALAAAIGIARAIRPSRVSAILIGIFGVTLLLAAIFPADPMEGFPPGTPEGSPEETSFAGVMHLVSGVIGFFALTAAFVGLGAWFAGRGDGRMAAGSRVAAIVVLAAFIGGAATATSTIGIALLWVAVLAGWTWLAVASVALYRTVPHPDLDRRR